MEAGKSVVSANEGGSSSSPPSSPSSPPPPAPFVLNPEAAEFILEENRSPEEERTLFITFSRGYPLTEPLITLFLETKYGPCVENVYIHIPDAADEPPMFGKVVFRSATTPLAIMRDADEVQFNINGKSMLCKKYQKKR